MINFRKKSWKMWRTLQKQDRGVKPRKQSTAFQGARISHTWFQGAKISHTLFQGAKSSVQREPFSHTPKPRCEIYFKVRKMISRCEFPKNQFRTPLWKVRKFSHCAKYPPSTRVPFSHTSSQFSPRAKQGAKFSHSAKLSAKCILRCEFFSPKGAIFAHLISRCENLHTSFQGANSSVQGVGFSHTQTQGAKISHGKILSSKNFKLTFKLKFYPRNCA